MAVDREAMVRGLMGRSAPMSLPELVAANQQRNPLVGLMSPVPTTSQAGAGLQQQYSLEDEMRRLLGGASTAPAVAQQQGTFSLENEMAALLGRAPSASAPAPEEYTPFQMGSISIGEKPKNAYHSGGAYENGDLSINHSMSFVKDGNKINAIIHDLHEYGEDGNTSPMSRNLGRIEEHKLKKSAQGYLEDQVDQETEGARWDSLTPAQQQAETQAGTEQKRAADRSRASDINDKVDGLIASGWRPDVNRHGGWARPEQIRQFASPQSEAMIKTRLRHHGIDLEAETRRARERHEYDQEWR